MQIEAMRALEGASGESKVGEEDWVKFHRKGGIRYRSLNVEWESLR